MPTWGKRSSPRDMIGEWIRDVEHKVLPDGEHQVWFYGSWVNWVFFQPVGCCNKVLMHGMNVTSNGLAAVSMAEVLPSRIVSIEFDHGKFTFCLDNGFIEMPWWSSKVGRNMTLDMIKLSKQELK